MQFLQKSVDCIFSCRQEAIRILPIFKYIKKQGNVNDEEMLRTFNIGVGIILVGPQDAKGQVIKHVPQYYDCYEIGSVRKGEKKIEFAGRLQQVWMQQKRC